MGISVSDALSAIMTKNVEAAKTVGKQDIGGVLNDRAVQIVKKSLKGKYVIAGAYLDTEVGKAIVANVLAGTVVKFFPENEKAVLASEMMVEAAMRDLGNVVDLRGMVNDFIDSFSELEAINLGKDE